MGSLVNTIKRLNPFIHGYTADGKMYASELEYHMQGDRTLTPTQKNVSELACALSTKDICFNGDCMDRLLEQLALLSNTVITELHAAPNVYFIGVLKDRVTVLRDFNAAHLHTGMSSADRASMKKGLWLVEKELMRIIEMDEDDRGILEVII